ncbi:hypothetical protein SCHPADRAFT_892214 [Schizopora paradoxa]|uniref:Uncharacterized protein n=1 Tax=Schizopora paradoxa TaxID=27342 RepID=A0A0H2RFQ0_9AGAM|nr:hypothetical protein SCHPADRAFT_892214 [Schizopora paradoxa]
MRERSEGQGYKTEKASLFAYAATKRIRLAQTSLIRTVGCLQLELDAEEKPGVHMYSVHPCSVKTAESSVSEDMERLIPGAGALREDVLLAMGKAKELRGRYIDVRNDTDLGIRELGRTVP